MIAPDVRKFIFDKYGKKYMSIAQGKMSAKVPDNVVAILKDLDVTSILYIYRFVQMPQILRMSLPSMFRKQWLIWV